MALNSVPVWVCFALRTDLSAIFLFMNEIWAKLKLFSVCLRVWVQDLGYVYPQHLKVECEERGAPPAGCGWVGCVMTQQSDRSRLSGPAHTSQTLSQSSLSPQCGGTAHESIPGGFHCFREALLRTSPLNGNHSCSCARADGGLQLHAGVALVFLWQPRCDEIWFTIEFYSICVHITKSD